MERKGRPRFAVVATLLLLLVFRAGAEDARPAAAQSEQDPAGIKFMLGAGDRVRLTVFGHEDLSGEFNVGDTGAVSLPLVGSLGVGGLTIPEAEELVVDALKPDYLLNPRVSIEILNYRPFYILGEVNRPGSYPYVVGMTVTEAVALGGGFTSRARKNRMAIIRSTDPAKGEAEVSATTTVLPGDVINVRERFF